MTIKVKLLISIILIVRFLDDDDEPEEFEESDITVAADPNGEEMDFTGLTGRRYSCINHSLQRCLFYGVQSTLQSAGAFKKLLKFQNCFAHSQQARSELKSKGKLYKTFIKVRWGTWVDVVKRYFEIKNNMIQVIFN